MVVKGKQGYYVYSSALYNGKRKRIGGPFPSKAAAVKMNKKRKSRKKSKR
jgi:hypothetical protein